MTKSHRDQRLDYREGEELSQCQSWSNSLWQGWSYGLVHCPGGNGHCTDLKSAGLFRRNLFLNSLKTVNIVTQTLTLTHGQSTLVYWIPYSSHTSHHSSQTPCLPWISYATQKLMLDSCKMLQKQSESFHTFLWHFFQV